MAFLSILDKQRTVAGPGFNRWLVPPAALALHFCIGQAYGYSVFKLPLQAACGWKETQTQWIFSTFIAVLGISAAIFGQWLERVGPRRAGVTAAFCWGGGYLVSALGVKTNQLWLVYLGNGVIGGCGLGLGYISPVSTLIKWFPDRRGLATGMAIMGFGGGALIGAPLSNKLMEFFGAMAKDGKGVSALVKDGAAVNHGVVMTFIALGVIYFVVMIIGAMSYRIPVPDWKPIGFVPKAKACMTLGHVHVKNAWKTVQFWLLWVVLCTNICAGISIIEDAAPMIQHIFSKESMGEKAAVTAAAAGGFVGLLSIANIFGRLGWASASDKLGRKMTYVVIFVLGMAGFALLPTLGTQHNLALFVTTCILLLTLYGGGFATIPAYLADIFGTQFVGAIHGRLLTAWSTAGVVGPLLLNWMHEHQKAAGVPEAERYNMTFYILAGLLFVGFVCNLLVRHVDEKHHMTAEELASARAAH